MHWDLRALRVALGRTKPDVMILTRASSAKVTVKTRLHVLAARLSGWASCRCGWSRMSVTVESTMSTTTHASNFSWATTRAHQRRTGFFHEKRKSERWHGSVSPESTCRETLSSSFCESAMALTPSRFAWSSILRA